MHQKGLSLFFNFKGTTISIEHVIEKRNEKNNNRDRPSEPWTDHGVETR